MLSCSSMKHVPHEITMDNNDSLAIMGYPNLAPCLSFVFRNGTVRVYNKSNH